MPLYGASLWDSFTTRRFKMPFKTLDRDWWNCAGLNRTFDARTLWCSISCIPTFYLNKKVDASVSILMQRTVLRVRRQRRKEQYSICPFRWNFRSSSRPFFPIQLVIRPERRRDTFHYRDIKIFLSSENFIQKILSISFGQKRKNVPPIYDAIRNIIRDHNSKSIIIKRKKYAKL